MLFSIITVCRNDYKGLKITYESLKNQNFSDYEWIVVDGDSSDGTKEWLANLSRDNCKWISEPDHGIFDAMNKGIALATGRYLNFMNSCDEFYDSDVLKNVCAAIQQNNNLRFIYGDSFDVTEEGKLLHKKSRSHKLCWMGMFACHQAMFVINDKSITYPLNYKFTADYAYVSLHLAKCGDINVYYHNEPICIFRLGGTSERIRYKALIEDYNIRRKIQKHGVLKCSALLCLHFMHTIIKKNLPYLSRKIRYN